MSTKVRIAPNLYLWTKPNGLKYYIARFKRNGKQIERSLGNADDVTLREVKMALARLTLTVDDEVKKEKEKAKVTFGEVLPKALADIAFVKQWKDDRSRRQWEQSLNDYALPVLGPLLIDEITREDVLLVLKPIWFTKTETATRVRMRLEAVFNWAIHKGMRSLANPAVWKTGLEFDLPPPAKIQKTGHHEAMTIEETKKAVAYCLAHPSPVSGAILFTIATAARVSEVRFAMADEIDDDVWMMPPERRKDRKPYPHRVPMSSLARQALKMASKKGLLFTASTKPLQIDSCRLKLVDIVGRKVTMHGCRSTFRDWCAENGKDRILAEKALMHTTGSEVEQAYQRSDLLERRRELMEEWAQMLTEA